MDETKAGTLPVTIAPDGQSEPRWPALVAFFTVWCIPQTTAQRTAHVSLGSAFLVHVLASLGAVLLTILFVAIAETLGPLGILGVIEALIDALAEIVVEIGRQPKENVLVLVIVVVLVELGFLAAALLVTPWGAQDEPIRSSFAHALRRVWLVTAHVLVAVFLVGVLGTTLSRMDTAWYAAYIATEPVPPQPPTEAPPGSRAWRAYEEAKQRYWREMRLWSGIVESKKPWHFRHLEDKIGCACLLSVFWIVWALLRSVAAPRRLAPFVRPPTCEACGYNLTAIPLESRCPECGEPVILSLGPNARAGTPWQRRREIGRLAALRRCSLDSFSRPRQFGRQIRIVSPGSDHGRFLCVHLPVIFAVSAFAMATYVVGEWVRRGRWYPGGSSTLEGAVLRIGGITGCLVVLAALGLTLLSAGLIGVWFSLRDKRNLLRGSVQVASYLAGMLTLWVALACALAVVLAMLENAGWFRAAETATGINDELLAFVTWLIPNLVCLVAYFSLVARGTAGLRYANW